jgi:hypothetical protein
VKAGREREKKEKEKKNRRNACRGEEKRRRCSG